MVRCGIQVGAGVIWGWAQTYPPVLRITAAGRIRNMM